MNKELNTRSTRPDVWQRGHCLVGLGAIPYPIVDAFCARMNADPESPAALVFDWHHMGVLVYLLYLGAHADATRLYLKHSAWLREAVDAHYRAAFPDIRRPLARYGLPDGPAIHGANTITIGQAHYRARLEEADATSNDADDDDGVH